LVLFWQSFILLTFIITEKLKKNSVKKLKQKEKKQELQGFITLSSLSSSFWRFL